jgi:hypothetical protein
MGCLLRAVTNQQRPAGMKKGPKICVFGPNPPKEEVEETKA